MKPEWFGGTFRFFLKLKVMYVEGRHRNNRSTLKLRGYDLTYFTLPTDKGQFANCYRVIFLTGPPLNLLSVGWKVTDFKKTLESQTGPP